MGLLGKTKHLSSLLAILFTPSFLSKGLICELIISLLPLLSSPLLLCSSFAHQHTISNSTTLRCPLADAPPLLRHVHCFPSSHLPTLAHAISHSRTVGLTRPLGPKHSALRMFDFILQCARLILFFSPLSFLPWFPLCLPPCTTTIKLPLWTPPTPLCTHSRLPQHSQHHTCIYTAYRHHWHSTLPSISHPFVSLP